MGVSEEESAAQHAFCNVKLKCGLENSFIPICEG